MDEIEYSLNRKPWQVKSNLKPKSDDYFKDMEQQMVEQFPSWLSKHREAQKVLSGNDEETEDDNITNLLDGDNYWGDKKSNRFNNQSNRISKRIDKAADSGNTDKVERLTSKLGSKANKLFEGKADGGADWASGGFAGLGEATSLIQNLTTDPTSKQEATGKVLSMAGSGAKIGGAIVPGIGHAVGAAAGAIGGMLDNTGWQKRLLAENDKEASKEHYENQNERLQSYYNGKNLKQLNAQRELLRKASGYSVTT